MSASRFVHYNPPGSTSQPPPTSASPQMLQLYNSGAEQNQTGTISPHQTQNQTIPVTPPTTNAPPSVTTTNNMLRTSGKDKATSIDWSQDLVKLARTAELKKHALTLQLATSHLVSAHAILDEQQQAVENVKEEKNRLESERTRLLECLRQVNEDRDKADLLLNDLTHKQTITRTQIGNMTSPTSQYGTAKVDVDRLRHELGEPPLPSLESILQDRVAKYLTERRLNGPSKRPAEAEVEGQPQVKRGRGRPRKLKP